MDRLTRETTIEIAGTLTDSQIARIIECGANEEDLLAALAWLNSDDAISRDIHHQPSGTVAEICEILAADEAIDEDETR